MKPAEPQKEHLWLKKFAGDWTCEMEASMGPDQPTATFKGTEKGRMLGELWMLSEGESEMPGGGTARTLMTVGYDPQRKAFVGSWIGSMMTHMWIYEGTLDEAADTLHLHAEGPSMSPEGGIAKYRDSIQFKGPDHRILTSQMIGPDGKWTPPFMTAHYRRRK